MRFALLIDRISFASTYVYSPRGVSETSRRSRRLRDLVKAGDAAAIPLYAAAVQELALEHDQFPGFFGRDVVFVPVPGSAPRVEGALWVPERLANELRALGLGSAVWTTLQRVAAVPKSAYAAPGERPTVEQHYESFEVEPSLAEPARIVLVDDVLTKGRTILAAASRLRDAFPNVSIRAFSLIRTMGLAPEVEQLLSPCVGEVDWHEGDARREP